MRTIFKTLYQHGSVADCNELRKHLITWAQNIATGYRVQASIGHTKKNADTMNAKAEGFDFMAKYLEGMEIVEATPTPKPVRLCPDTDKACEENCGPLDCHLKLSKAGLFDI